MKTLQRTSWVSLDDSDPEEEDTRERSDPDEEDGGMSHKRGLVVPLLLETGEEAGEPGLGCGSTPPEMENPLLNPNKCVEGVKRPG